MSYVPAQDDQKTAYGDLATNQSTPVIQVSAQYGILKDVDALTGPSGTASAVDSKYHCESGTDPAGFGSISTSRALIFRPGQGEKDLFSARFSAGQAGSEQFAGLANTNEGGGFGYNGTEFGILVRNDGAIEIQELTVTTPAGGAENATVTVDGTGYTVPLTAGTVQHNASEIAASLTSQVTGWFFEAVDDQVITTAFIAQAVVGAFAFTSATAVAAWVQDAAGVLPTDTWTAQADWNIDPLPSLDPDKINNYKIQIGPNIGFFSILDSETNKYTLVHVINANNFTSDLIIENPTFGHIWYALNRGGTTSVTTEGSYSGLYREGPDIIVNADSSQRHTLIGVGTTITPLMSFRGRSAISSVINLATAIIKSMQITTDSTRTIFVTISTNATLTGANFQYISKPDSILEIDTSATLISGISSDNSISISGLSSITAQDLDIPIAARDTVTVSVSVSSGPASEFIGTVGYVEDL
jgi:hypothetical protein